MTPATSERILHDHGPVALVGIGGVLAVSMVGLRVLIDGRAHLFTTRNLTIFGFTFVLAGTIAGCGLLLHRSSVPPARYPRVVLWCLGSAACFLAINLPMMPFVPRLTTGDLLGWGHYALTIGATGGACVGVIEARAIEQVRVAEREATRAANRTAEIERLEYLNGLLRHEVLNHANVVVGHAELARAESDGTVDDYLATIHSHGEDMAAIIDDVRVLIDALQTSGEDQVDLSAVLTTEIEKVEATHESVEVETTIPDVVYVSGDDLLARVFGNLLANAIEHNDSERPWIGVTVDPAPETVLVRIADDGPGIPEHQRATLFEKSQGNHGLGLYLVRLLVERYDGSVELGRTGPEGSVFVVALPRTGSTEFETSADATRQPGSPEHQLRIGEVNVIPADS